MRHTLAQLGRAFHSAPMGTLALALAGCAGPLRLATTPEPPPTAQVLVVPSPAPAPVQPSPATPTAATVDCAPTTDQPTPGEPITLLSRVAGCPSLVRVEWRTTILLVPVEFLGLRESDLTGLPEEVR